MTFRIHMIFNERPPEKGRQRRPSCSSSMESERGRREKGEKRKAAGGDDYNAMPTFVLYLVYFASRVSGSPQR